MCKFKEKQVCLVKTIFVCNFPFYICLCDALWQGRCIANNRFQESEPRALYNHSLRQKKLGKDSLQMMLGMTGPALPEMSCFLFDVLHSDTTHKHTPSSRCFFSLQATLSVLCGCLQAWSLWDNTLRSEGLVCRGLHRIHSGTDLCPEGLDTHKSSNGFPEWIPITQEVRHTAFNWFPAYAACRWRALL